MRQRSVIVAAVAAMTTVGLVVACDDSGNRGIPTSPSGPSVSSVEIIGPGTIAPGQSAQFTVRISYSDGSTSPGSPDMGAIWQSSSLSRLRVDASGLATAQDQAGDVILTAFVRIEGRERRSTKEIVIVPDGTFRLVGAVRDAEFLGMFIVGARVEVTPGPLATTTDTDGRYRLYGVPPEADVRITRDGYQPHEEGLRLTAHTTQDFRLTVSGPRLQLTGDYTLAIDAGACSGSMPTDLQHRRYEATLTTTNGAVQVTLTEPRFRLNSNNRGNRFVGYVDGAGASFTLEPFFWYYYPYYGPGTYPNVAEQLPDGTVLVTEGRVVMTGSAAALSGQMSGGSFLTLWNAGFPTNTSVLGTCNSLSPLVVTLTRR